MACHRNIIGQSAAVKVGNSICFASVIDKVAGTNRAKRVRLLSGEQAGEVLMLGQYEILRMFKPPRKKCSVWEAFCAWAASFGD